MRKLKLIKVKELAIKVEESIYCDFCGEKELKVFTSSYDDSVGTTDTRKCEMQICFNCVNQLYKFTPLS